MVTTQKRRNFRFLGKLPRALRRVFPTFGKKLHSSVATIVAARLHDLRFMGGRAVEILRSLLVAVVLLNVTLGPAPASEPRATSSPLPRRADSVHRLSDGARLYQRHCARCHGVSAKGEGPDASLFDPPPTNLRANVLDRYPENELVERVRLGTPLSLAREPLATYARAVEVEEIVGYLRRLPTLDWLLIERGAETYVDRCEVCHGPYGRPGPVPPPGVRTPDDLSSAAFQRSHSDPELLLAVRHGRTGMPALVPRVDENEALALAGFVRLLSPGFELYSRYCASCHGDDGHPAQGLAGSVPRPTVVFDRAYFAARDPEALRASVWHMLSTERPAMPHLRAFVSEAETRAILAHLRGLR